MKGLLQRLVVVSVATVLFVFGYVGAVPVHASDCAGQGMNGCRTYIGAIDLVDLVESIRVAISVIL